MVLQLGIYLRVPSAAGLKFDLWGSLRFLFARVTVDSSEIVIAFSSGLLEARPLSPRFEKLGFYLSGDIRKRVSLFSVDLNQQSWVSPFFFYLQKYASSSAGVNSLPSGSGFRLWDL